MKKLWRKFEGFTSKCYINMIQSNTDISIWHDTFLVLIEIINVGRNQNSNFAPELYNLDESTDYKYDVGGFLEDYLDELDMYQQYEKVQQVCEKLIDLFEWKEDQPSDLRFRIASALGAQKKDAKRLAFCEDWYKKESDNISAAVALIYARTAAKDLSGAEQVVDSYISEGAVCTDENVIIYTAAEQLYKVSRNKKAEEQVKQSIKKYEDELEEYYSGIGGEDLDFISDEELPFS